MSSVKEFNMIILGSVEGCIQKAADDRQETLGPLLEPSHSMSKLFLPKLCLNKISFAL